MGISRSIRNNLHFLIVEVGFQVSSLQACLDTPSKNVSRRVLDRSGYAYNLMLRIHDSCHNQVIKAGESGTDAASLRAIESIASDLEHITGLCRECIQQLDQLRSRRCPGAGTCKTMLERITRGLDQIEPAIRRSNTRLALKIGRVKTRLDETGLKLVKKNTTGLKRKKRTEDLVAGLFIAHGIEQMGDAMLNISEAIISANLGQPINIDRYHSLRASMDLLDTASDASDLVVEQRHFRNRSNGAGKNRLCSHLQGRQKTQVEGRAQGPAKLAGNIPGPGAEDSFLPQARAVRLIIDRASGRIDIRADITS